MNRLRRMGLAPRRVLAAVLALAIGVWLAMPPGFMPVAENGKLAIVPCPGSDGTIDIVIGSEMTMPAMQGMAMEDDGHHHHGAADAFHNTCQYAAAVALLSFGSGAPPLPPAMPAVSNVPVALALPVFQRRAVRERPPSQGPPLPV
jgi:hypothetical protein